jgi:hypothetical protein
MPRTLRNFNELTTIANDDWVHVNEVSDPLDQDKKITRFNLVGTAISGGGAINTGGFTLTVPATGTAVLKQGTPVAARAVRWNDSNKVEDAGIAFDQMVRKTGTPVLNNLTTWHDANTVKDGGFAVSDIGRLSIPQSYSALPTFNAGLSLGAAQTTLAYYHTGSFTPKLSFSGGDGGYTTSTSIGVSMRIGTFVSVEMDIRLSALGTASGSVRITDLPFPPTGSRAVGVSRWTALTTAFSYMTARANAGMLVLEGATGASVTTATAVTAANLSNTSTFLVSMCYICAP